MNTKKVIASIAGIIILLLIGWGLYSLKNIGFFHSIAMWSYKSPVQFWVSFGVATAIVVIGIIYAIVMTSGSSLHNDDPFMVIFGVIVLAAIIWFILVMFLMIGKGDKQREALFKSAQIERVEHC